MPWQKCPFYKEKKKKKGRLKIAKLPSKAQQGIFGCPSTSVCVIDKLHTKAPPGPSSSPWLGSSGAVGAGCGVGALSSIPRAGSCQTWNPQQCRGIIRAARPVGAVVLQSRSHGNSGKCRRVDHRGRGRRLGLHGRGEGLVPVHSWALWGSVVPHAMAGSSPKLGRSRDLSSGRAVPRMSGAKLRWKQLIPPHSALCLPSARPPSLCPKPPMVGDEPLGVQGLLSPPALHRTMPCGAGGRVVLALMTLMSLSFAAGECQGNGVTAG